MELSNIEGIGCKKVTQQDHITTKAAVAATFYVYRPIDPQWKNYVNGSQTHTVAIYGVEYEFSATYPGNLFSKNNNGGNRLAHNPAPCAVCYVGGRSTVLMIPARTQCPDGWTTEYAGYLVSEWTVSSRKRSNYVCWDEAPEVVVGGSYNQNQALIYPVEVQCGSLPCSLYINGRELTCIVCSK